MQPLTVFGFRRYLFSPFFQGNGNPVLLWREVSPIAGELGKGVLLTRSKHLLKTSEWNLKSS